MLPAMNIYLGLENVIFRPVSADVHSEFQRELGPHIYDDIAAMVLHPVANGLLPIVKACRVTADRALDAQASEVRW